MSAPIRPAAPPGSTPSPLALDDVPGAPAPAGAADVTGAMPAPLAVVRVEESTVTPLAAGLTSEAPSGVPDVRELADAFFARYAGTTLRTYRQKLGAFARWLGVPLAHLPAALLARGAAGAHLDLERYRAWLRDERRASPATINGHLAAVRSVVRFLRRAQLCTWTLDVPSERIVAYRDTRGPGLAAVRALLRTAARQGDARKVARDVALVRLLVDRALRRSEVVGLDVAHVERDPAGAPVAVRVRGKGRGERERLTLPGRTAAALAGWLAARGAEPGPLFVALDPGAGRVGRGRRARAPLERLTGEGVARILAALARQAGLDGPVRPHGLRHTAITAVLDAGVGLREAQRYSRHADPRTLLRYDDNRTDLAGAVAQTVSELL
jgi:integrase/recombinase XerC